MRGESSETLARDRWGWR